MSSTTKRLFQAHATVKLASIDTYVEPFIEALASHDMIVSKRGTLQDLESPFGKATFEPVEDGFKLTAEAHDPSSLNRLKHALVGPICFIASREKLDIDWVGDYAEPALPDDLRFLHVVSINDISPTFRRIVFHGENLERYDRDDQLHCRLIFQPRGIGNPVWPRLDHRGHVVWPPEGAVPTRVYTIRGIDVSKGQIIIDFALHENPGPATRWALAAQIGDLVGILGPAANGPKPAKFYVLAGDETALPGIARILETLDDDATGIAFIEIATAEDKLPLQKPKGMTMRWLHRQDAAPATTTLLPDAVRSVAWPENRDEAFFWGGCEHKTFAKIYRHLRREVSLPKERMIFYSHWNKSLSEEDIIARGSSEYLPE
ncbi:siderophore-interacting protein [Agrobacterium cavarae]|uniref:siderophore-interacting protein n=1 Tax=Agrobacterium cavarae TaxID=2528239 RepID=UPI0028A7458A|nr:siderophore-interacting protein [Agrobacterium cavarae]